MVRCVDYNAAMGSAEKTGRRFSLGEARALLPTVKRVTAEAVRDTEALATRLHGLDLADPGRQRLSDELEQIVTRWAHYIQEMDLEAKGLWLVDFDNGEGYYCWCYPEESITHYHGYAEGFAGRMKIV